MPETRGDNLSPAQTSTRLQGAQLHPAAQPTLSRASLSASSWDRILGPFRWVPSQAHLYLTAQVLTLNELEQT